jgi:hypothetical protein
MAEYYIRPPLHAEEPTPWVAVWRFRVFLTLLAAALATLVVVALVTFVHPSGERNPGVGAARAAVSPAAPPIRGR